MTNDQKLGHLARIAADPRNADGPIPLDPFGMYRPLTCPDAMLTCPDQMGNGSIDANPDRWHEVAYLTWDMAYRFPSGDVVIC